MNKSLWCMISLGRLVVTPVWTLSSDMVHSGIRPVLTRFRKVHLRTRVRRINHRANHARTNNARSAHSGTHVSTMEVERPNICLSIINRVPHLRMMNLLREWLRANSGPHVIMTRLSKVRNLSSWNGRNYPSICCSDILTTHSPGLIALKWGPLLPWEAQVSVVVRVCCMMRVCNAVRFPHRKPIDPIWANIWGCVCHWVWPVVAYFQMLFHRLN